MLKYFLVMFLFVLFGCHDGLEDPDYQKALKEYICTQKQMQKVEHESDWCTNNTFYIKTFCYGTAIMRNCKKMKKEETK